MGRKIEQGYSPKNLADFASRGIKIELSLVPVGKKHVTFFRECGKTLWLPVVNQRKDGPLAYRSVAVGPHLLRLLDEVPGVPVRLYYEGRLFFDSKQPDPIHDLLAARYAELADFYKAQLFTTLGIGPDHPNPVWVIEQKLTYPPHAPTSMAHKLLLTYLSLPTDWETLLPPMA